MPDHLRCSLAKYGVKTMALPDVYIMKPYLESLIIPVEDDFATLLARYKHVDEYSDQEGAQFP
jgi:hypothetical protein